ncbi:MAG: fumarate hydratase, partial [Firmicutes bacterium]|nr:fumarate hydratase [Bacillota bacterium]
LRPMGEHNEDPFYEEMEERLLHKINELNVGPQGFGGKTTALAVNIIAAPTHIAGMPVAVNINCHVSRHKEVII